MSVHTQHSNVGSTGRYKIVLGHNEILEDGRKKPVKPAPAPKIYSFQLVDLKGRFLSCFLVYRFSYVGWNCNLAHSEFRALSLPLSLAPSLDLDSASRPYCHLQKRKFSEIQIPPGIFSGYLPQSVASCQFIGFLNHYHPQFSLARLTAQLEVYSRCRWRGGRTRTGISGLACRRVWSEFALSQR